MPVTSEFFQRRRRTARSRVVVVLGRRRVHEPWPDASREVRELWKGCLVLRDDMSGRRALHQPDDVQQRRERSALVSQWADESKPTPLTLWGAERRGRRPPVRIRRCVVECADRGLHGSTVAHAAGFQRGQQDVIFPVPCRHELSESVELAVGDMAVGELAGRSRLLVTSAAARRCDRAVRVDHHRSHGRRPGTETFPGKSESQVPGAIQCCARRGSPSRPARHPPAATTGLDRAAPPHRAARRSRGRPACRTSTVRTPAAG